MIDIYSIRVILLVKYLCANPPVRHVMAILDLNHLGVGLMPTFSLLINGMEH